MRSAVASENEVMKKYTEILRGEFDGDIKVGDVIRAGDALLKRMDMKKEEKRSSAQCGVVLIPMVNEKEEN